jgi:hypothetical protein
VINCSVRWGFPRIRGQSRETVKCRNFLPNQALYKDEPQSEIELFTLVTDQARCNSHVQISKLKSQTNFKLEISNTQKPGEPP